MRKRGSLLRGPRNAGAARHTTNRGSGLMKLREFEEWLSRRRVERETARARKSVVRPLVSGHGLTFKRSPAPLSAEAVGEGHDETRAAPVSRVCPALLVRPSHRLSCTKSLQMVQLACQEGGVVLQASGFASPAVAYEPDVVRCVHRCWPLPR